MRLPRVLLRAALAPFGPLAAAAVLLVATAPAAAQCEAAKLLPTTGAAFDEFGTGVAVDGELAVVGAPLANIGGPNEGSATVFRRAGAAWVEEQRLSAADLSAGAEFGFSVAVDGDVIVVGAPRDDEAGLDAGAVYVFRHDGAVWNQEAKLLSGARDPLDEFGYSVALSGDVLAVGAWHDDDLGTKAGRAYVFRWNGLTWDPEASLVGSDVSIEDKFGEALDVDGEILAVGARGDEEVAMTAGAVYVFRHAAGVWTEETKLTASDGAAFDRLGQSVAVDGDVIVAGAWSAEPGKAYVFRWNGASWDEEARLDPEDGDPAMAMGQDIDVSGDLVLISARDDDDQGTNSGAAYLFRRIDGAWEQKAKLTPKDGDVRDQFGFSVALDGALGVIGAYNDDDQGTDAGSAYVFDDLDEYTTWELIGYGLHGITGIPCLEGGGTLAGGTPITVDLSGALPGAVAWLVVGFAPLFAPLEGGTLVPAPDVTVVLPVGPGGGLAIADAFPPGVPADFTFYLQYWIADPAGPNGFAASNAVSATTP